MKTFCLSLLCAAVLLALSVAPAGARPQYKKVWEAHYKVTAPSTDAEKSLAAAVKTAKCNVCHKGKSKKMRNAYGTALMKMLPKYDKEAWKTGSADKEKKAAELLEVIKKVEATKTDSGKTYGELLKEGKLPVEAK